LNRSEWLQFLSLSTSWALSAAKGQHKSKTHDGFGAVIDALHLHACWSENAHSVAAHMGGSFAAGHAKSSMLYSANTTFNAQ
jgi:hypothetical protein